MRNQRIVYHIDGKDYEANEMVNLTIRTYCVSIQNVKNLLEKHKIKIKNIGNKRLEPLNQYNVSETKEIQIFGWPENLVSFFQQEMHVNEWSEINNNFNIRNNVFKAFGRKLQNRINFYEVFDPITKKTAIRSNAPVKIEKQSVLNGKLWRKLPVKY